jgi:hypothetical protein
MHQGFNSRKPLTAWLGELLFFQCVNLNGGIDDINLVVMCDLVGKS